MILLQIVWSIRIGHLYHYHSNQLNAHYLQGKSIRKWKILAWVRISLHFPYFYMSVIINTSFFFTFNIYFRHYQKISIYHWLRSLGHQSVNPQSCHSVTLDRNFQFEIVFLCQVSSLVAIYNFVCWSRVVFFLSRLSLRIRDTRRVGWINRGCLNANVRRLEAQEPIHGMLNRNDTIIHKNMSRSFRTNSSRVQK